MVGGLRGEGGGYGDWEEGGCEEVCECGGGGVGGWWGVVGRNFGAVTEQQLNV